MWGLYGTPLGMVGIPYLITGTACDSVNPVKFAKIYIKELKEMKSLFPVLENYVHAEHNKAVSMLELARFKLSEPVIINNEVFYRFTAVQ
jgi:hypothetical protein